MREDLKRSSPEVSWGLTESQKLLKEEERKKMEAELRSLVASKELKKLMETVESQKLRNKLKDALWDAKEHNIDELANDPEKLKQALNVLAELRESTKENLNDYKREVEKSFYRAKNSYATNKIFSEKFLQKLEDPQNIIDQIMWVMVGLLNNLETGVIFWKDLVVGFVKAPYDIYKDIKKWNSA